MTNDNKSHRPDAHGRAIRKFAFKLTAVFALKYGLALVTLWLFAWGTLVLGFRAATNIPRGALVWGIAGVAVAMCAALILAKQRAPEARVIRAVLDNHSGCGGLLMAEESEALGGWGQRMPSVALPRLHWQRGRSSAIFLAAAGFLVVSFLVPVRLFANLAANPLDVGRETERLGAEIETLKKEEIIDAAKAESLEEKVAQIQSDASGQDPGKTWEALDHVQESVSKIAQEAAEKMAKTAEQLGQAEALSQALAEGGSGMDSKLMTEAMKELSKLSEAAGDKGLSDSGFSKEALDGLKAGSLSKEQLKALSKALGKNRSKLTEQAKKLRDAGLIDLKSYKKCEGGKCDGQGLAQFLKDNEGEMSVEESMGRWGRGGIDRGRGDAPMSWSDGTSEQGAKFKEKVLTPSVLAGLKDSELIGRSTGTPTIEKSGSSKAGSLVGASSGGGSAFTQTVLPRHKGAVKRYFERK